MKAYFVGSIKGRENLVEDFERILTFLKKSDYSVLEDTLRPTIQEVYNLEDDQKVNYYKQVLKWINDADVVVAEASYPSIGVGYEISLAVGKNKPVIVMSQNDEASHFLEGIHSEKLIVVNYDSNNLEEVLDSALNYAVEQMDTRFNFFIAPKHQNYLDWVAKHRRIPRAVYLRRLIEEDMKKNPEFLK